MDNELYNAIVEIKTLHKQAESLLDEALTLTQASPVNYGKLSLLLSDFRAKQDVEKKQFTQACLVLSHAHKSTHAI